MENECNNNDDILSEEQKNEELKAKREKINAEKREARRIAKEKKKAYKLKLKNGEISILDDLYSNQEKLKKEISDLQETFNKNQSEIDKILLAEKMKIIDNVSLDELKRLLGK